VNVRSTAAVQIAARAEKVRSCSKPQGSTHW
jgi:hypothetical protein